MYLLDANVLIEAKNRHYAFDIVPAFWDWLTREHQAGKVFTVQKVAEEIFAGGDELSEWLKAQAPTFRIAPTSDDQSALQTVAAWASGSGFIPAAVSTFLQSGDYFLVAQAVTLGYPVVTQETSDPKSKKRVKIPDACNALGVKWTSPFQMLSAEGAKFKL